jgi:hypothetical protein
LNSNHFCGVIELKRKPASDSSASRISIKSAPTFQGGNYLEINHSAVTERTILITLCTHPSLIPSTSYKSGGARLLLRFLIFISAAEAAILPIIFHYLSADFLSFFSFSDALSLLLMRGANEQKKERFLYPYRISARHTLK